MWFGDDSICPVCALHDLVHMLDAEGSDFVFIPVDRIDATRLGQIRLETGPCELCHRGVDFSPLLVEVANGS